MSDLRADPWAWREAPSVCSIAVAAIGVSAAVGIGGALIQGNAAHNAAQMQTQAESQAAQLMHDQYLQTRSDLLPYNTAGQTAFTQLGQMAPYDPGAPFNFQPTQAQLEATPGYQFNLSQGLKSVQNSAAARGLGVSGAALKGAAGYASGLADTTYQNQFANALGSYTTNVNTGLQSYGANVGRLQNIANTGENAAAQTGAYGTTTAGNIGQTLVGAANAGAAGQVGVANAAAGGLGTIGNAFLLGTQGGMFGGGGGFGGQTNQTVSQIPVSFGPDAGVPTY